MAQVSAALAGGAALVVGALKDWPEYRLVVASNALVLALDEELAAVHRFVCDAFAPRFPELASIVPAARNYVRLVRLISAEPSMDLTRVDMSAVLSSTQAMVVTVTGSATSGAPLAAAALAGVLAACDEFQALEAARAQVLDFVASRMHAVAPNLSVLLGTQVAARLVGVIGGVAALARTPGCNVATIGQRRRVAGTGMGGRSGGAGAGAGGAGASAPAMPHAGVIYEAPVCLSAPTAALRAKCAQVVATKAVLAARVDAFRSAPTGETGRAFLALVEQKLAAWQMPPPARAPKPLKAPDDRPSKRRGGRRARALKEKLGMTDVRKEANRVSLTGGGEYGDAAMGWDRGMLHSGAGVEGGRLRGADRKKGQEAQRNLLNTKRRRLLVGQAGAGGAAAGGTLSSFSFTPVQGIELVNPLAQRAAAAAAAAAAAGRGAGAGAGAVGGEGYFSGTGAFSGAK